jgi:hypothetical protein
MDGGIRWPAGWLLTARVAWFTGRPYTPIDVAGSVAAGRQVYDLTAVNRERAPDYFRLDLRMERSLAIRGTDLTLFGGVQNATNRRNFAGFYWNRRANSIVFQEQMGVFPLIGLDWRF